MSYLTVDCHKSDVSDVYYAQIEVSIVDICPHCKGEELVLERDGDAIYVKCESCGASGPVWHVHEGMPYEMCVAGAIIDWNKRY